MHASDSLVIWKETEEKKIKFETLQFLTSDVGFEIYHEPKESNEWSWIYSLDIEIYKSE